MKTRGLILVMLLSITMGAFAQSEKQNKFGIKVITDGKTLLDTTFTDNINASQIKEVLKKYVDTKTADAFKFENPGTDGLLSIITEKGKTKMMVTAESSSDEDKKLSFTAIDGGKKGKFLFVSEEGDTTVVGKAGEVIVLNTNDKELSKEHAFEFHTLDTLKNGKKVMVFSNNDGEKHVLKANKIIITDENNSGSNSGEKAVWITKDAGDGTKTITITTDGTDENTIIETNEPGEKNIKVFVRKADGAEMTEEHEITIINGDKISTEKKIIIKNDKDTHKKGDKDEMVFVWKNDKDNKNAKTIKLKLTSISDAETLKKLGVKQEQKLELKDFMLNASSESEKLTLSFKSDKAEKFEIGIFDQNFKPIFTDKTKSISDYKKETTVSATEKGTFYVVVSTKDKSFSLHLSID